MHKAEVASFAKSIVQDFVAQLSSSSNGIESSCSWIMQRIVKQVEKLSVLLMRGNKTEMKLELQTTTGYILCLKPGLDGNTPNSASFQQALVRKSKASFSEKL